MLQDDRIKGKLRYLLRFQPEAERQRFLWIHGEIGLPSYTEKLDRAVIPLSSHHGRPRSTDTVSSPSAIVRTDRRMPLPVSTARTEEPTGERT